MGDKQKSKKNTITTSEGKQLTPKQAVFYHEWLNNGGNGTRAALKAYNCTVESAAQIATQNLRKLQNPMKFYLEHKGIGVKTASDVVLEAMQATKWNEFTGEREPDHNVRLKAADKLSRWMDIDTSERISFVQFKQENINIIGSDGKPVDL